MSASPSLKTCRLPNGFEIHHHQPYETDFVYREIFIEQLYTRPFMDALKGLGRPPCVVDAGANIGLFSLFIKQQFPQASIYAFEPSPTHIELLKKNLAVYPDAHVFQLGLGEKNERRLFTYYPHYSIMSGFHGNATEDRKLLEAGIATKLAFNEATDAQEARKYLELLVDNKLDDGLQMVCDVVTLSSVMAGHGIEKIDLLKIDAEKAELDILKGIASPDWKKIHRIVVEAHGMENGELAKKMLTEKGFQVEMEKSADYNHTVIFILYAMQPGAS